MKAKNNNSKGHVNGEPCPVCGTTLEWSGTKECATCGYDKP